MAQNCRFWIFEKIFCFPDLDRFVLKNAEKWTLSRFSRKRLRISFILEIKMKQPDMLQMQLERCPGKLWIWI